MSDWVIGCLRLVFLLNLGLLEVLLWLFLVRVWLLVFCCDLMMWGILCVFRW